MPHQRKLKMVPRRAATKRRYAESDDESPGPTSSWPSARKLPKDAYKVLAGFFHKVTEYPTRQQKHALAVQIAQLEGCEGYNVARVQAYFKDKRKLAHRRAARDGDAATLVSKHAAQAAAVAAPRAEQPPLPKTPARECTALSDVPEVAHMVQVHPERPSTPAPSPRTFEQLQTWLRAQNSLLMSVRARIDAHSYHNAL